MFPDDSRGQYVNKVDFGLVKADLLANYERPQKDRINVAFEWIRFMLGPLSFKKVGPSHILLGRAVGFTSCPILSRTSLFQPAIPCCELLSITILGKDSFGPGTHCESL